MWEILGIEPTTDLKTIKKAYAKLVKQYNPEEHPEEFQRIYAAYKRACICAKAADSQNEAAAKKKSEEKPTDRSVENDTANEILHFDFSTVDIFTDYDLPIEKRFEKMLDNIHNLLIDDERKDSITQWLWIFQKDDFELLSDSADFRASANKLFEKESFSPETASAIARVFGHSSRAIPCEKDRSGRERWRVWISGSGTKAPLRGYRMPSYMNSASYDEPFYISVGTILKIIVIIIIIVLILIKLPAMIDKASEGDDKPRPVETTSVTQSGEMGELTLYFDENGTLIGMDK